MELKKQKEVMEAAEKLRREKWIQEKTLQIKVGFQISQFLCKLKSIAVARLATESKFVQNIKSSRAISKLHLVSLASLEMLMVRPKYG